MTRVRVFADDDRYRIALAELTASAVSVPSVDEADVVIASRAVLGGPEQVVLVSTGAGSPVDPSSGAKVVVERPWLRPDVVQDVTAARGWFPRIEIDVAAPAATLPAVLADAVGWVRVLAGAEPEPRAGAATRVGGIADARAGESVVTLQLRRRESGSAVLRVAGIGPRRVEIRIDDERRRATVRVVDDEGARTLPERWEDAARLTLSRAVDMVRTGERSGECDQWERDSAIAARVLGLITEGDEGDRQPRIP